MTLRASLRDLRDRAARCLADERPTPGDAHALASVALGLVARIESEIKATPMAHPYRSSPPVEAPAVEVATLVALERALEECQGHLHAARAEIDRLRALPRPV